MLALYVATAKKQGVDTTRLSGTVQNDILKEYIARKTYIYPPTPSMRLVVDLMRYCRDNVPRWNTISISGYHIREAGSSAVQEIAFTLANGITYVRKAIEAGLEVDSFAPRLSFFFNAHINLLEEVAKFRAARRLWCRIMRDEFHAENPRSLMLRFHTQTAGSSLTAQQPDVNVVRTTLEALAAVLGGTQSLHTNSRDEALGLPTSETAKLALRTQQVIAHESGVADVPDPFGGSYYIESLTDELESQAAGEIEKIERMGGSIAAIEQNYIQDSIAREAYKYQLDIEREQRIVVGVNRFVDSDEVPPEILKISAESETGQIERLKNLKTLRNNELAVKKLTVLEEASHKSTEPLMELIVEAVEAHCTVGEISDVFRNVWGVYQDR